MVMLNSWAAREVATGFFEHAVALTLGRSGTSSAAPHFGALHEIAGGGNGAVDGAAAAPFAAGIAARTQGRVPWGIAQPGRRSPRRASNPIASSILRGGEEKTVVAYSRKACAPADSAPSRRSGAPADDGFTTAPVRG